MSYQNTANTSAFIEAQQYSKFIIDNLYDNLLPDTFTRDVSDFGSGTTLNIKTVGATNIQDVQEDVAMTFSPIDTGNVTMSITDYIGDAWAISDELREDGSQVETLSAMRAKAALYAIQESVESKFLKACNAAQTANNANILSGTRHRFVGNGLSKQIEISDFAYMNHSMTKANVPGMGRIAIVDSIVGLTFDTLTNLVNVSNNPMFQGMITEGFANEHKFVRNVNGWDVYTSNRLPKLTAAEGALTDRDGNVTAGAIGDVANIFMCIADDNVTPMMRAWRRMPSVEGWREQELRQDRFQVSARFGFGAQRTDSLGVIVTSATEY